MSLGSRVFRRDFFDFAARISAMDRGLAIVAREPRTRENGARQAEKPERQIGTFQVVDDPTGARHALELRQQLLDLRRAKMMQKERSGHDIDAFCFKWQLERIGAHELNFRAWGREFAARFANGARSNRAR